MKRILIDDDTLQSSSSSSPSSSPSSAIRDGEPYVRSGTTMMTDSFDQTHWSQSPSSSPSPSSPSLFPSLLSLALDASSESESSHLRSSLRHQRRHLDQSLGFELQMRLVELKMKHEFKEMKGKMIKQIQKGDFVIRDRKEKTSSVRLSPSQPPHRRMKKLQAASPLPPSASAPSYTRNLTVRGDLSEPSISLPFTIQLDSNLLDTSTSDSVPFAALPLSSPSLSPSVLSSRASLLPSSMSTHSTLLPQLSGLDSTHSLGHGYLTGSQTARHLQHHTVTHSQSMQTTLGVPTASEQSSSNHDLTNSQSHQTLLEHPIDVRDKDENGPSTAHIVIRDLSRRWGGTTDFALVASDSCQQPLPLPPPPVPPSCNNALVSLPQASTQRRASNAYLQSSSLSPRPSLTALAEASLPNPNGGGGGGAFGSSLERAICQSSMAADLDLAHRVGPYTQNVSHTSIANFTRPHVSSPQFRRSSSRQASGEPSRLSSKIASSLYQLARSSLDLDSFRRSTLQPLANSDTLGRSTAADVRGGNGFNLATALGGLLSGNGLASTGGVGSHEMKLRHVSLTPMKVDGGPGMYHHTPRVAEQVQTRHVATHHYAPLPLTTNISNHQLERYTYIPNRCTSIEDHPAPWKYEPKTERKIVGTPSIGLAPKRQTQLNATVQLMISPFSSSNGLTLPSPSSSLGAGAAVGSYHLSQFPSPSHGAKISISHSEWGSTPRFHDADAGSSQAGRDLRELQRLLADSHFKGKHQLALSRKGKTSTTPNLTHRQPVSPSIRKKAKTKSHTVANDTNLDETQQQQHQQVSANNQHVICIDSDDNENVVDTASVSSQEQLIAREEIKSKSDEDEKVQSPAGGDEIARLLSPSQSDVDVQPSSEYKEDPTVSSSSVRIRSSSRSPSRRSLSSSPLASSVNSQRYLSNLSQFSPRAQLERRREQKEQRHQRCEDVLTTHRRLMHQQRFGFEQKISKTMNMNVEPSVSSSSHVPVHIRLSHPHFHPSTIHLVPYRWFDLLAATVRLQHWIVLLHDHRARVAESSARHVAAVRIQTLWRRCLHRQRTLATRQSFEVLRRNFRVLFFKQRIKRRIKARKMIIQFFKDVIMFQQCDNRRSDEPNDLSPSSVAVMCPQSLPLIGSESDSSSSSLTAVASSHRRRAVHSVVAVIRHFKLQICRIQRAIRRYFQLRRAQLDALVRLYDAVYDRQRKLWIEYSRRYKALDTNALIEQAHKEQHKYIARQQHIQQSQCKVTPSTTNEQTSHNNKHNNNNNGSTTDESSNLSRPSSISTITIPLTSPRFIKSLRSSQTKLLSHSPPTSSIILSANSSTATASSFSFHLPTSSSASPSKPITPNHLSSLSSASSPQRSMAHTPISTHRSSLNVVEENKSIEGDAQSTMIERLKPPSPSISSPSSHPPSPSSSPPPSSPSPPSSSHTQHMAPPPLSSLPFPQIFHWSDRRLTENEKRHYLLIDWKLRHQQFVRAKDEYRREEAKYVQDQCGGLTAAKRLLQLPSPSHCPSSSSSFSSSSSLYLSSSSNSASCVDPSSMLMSPSLARSRFRSLHPMPTFRGLITPTQMIQFIQNTMNTHAHHGSNNIHIDHGANHTTHSTTTNDKKKVQLSPSRRVSARRLSNSTSSSRSRAHQHLITKMRPQPPLTRQLHRHSRER